MEDLFEKAMGGLTETGDKAKEEEVAEEAALEETGVEEAAVEEEGNPVQAGTK